MKNNLAENMAVGLLAAVLEMRGRKLRMRKWRDDWCIELNGVSYFGDTPALAWQTFVLGLSNDELISIIKGAT